ncbi:MAG: 4a-hydroxytetrahydrobiopterin dehydratase [Desulfuromonadales bacterium]|jgi:4a-hydroxytetrahydrobiopterin dehydratase
MTDLVDKNCTACRAGAPLATATEIEQYLPQLPGWRITEADGIKRLEKSFSCKDFAGALALTNRIGAIAEQENHHPAIVTEWGRVTVSWWTHVIAGLHVNDFIMAAKTDRACTAPAAAPLSPPGTA